MTHKGELFHTLYPKRTKIDWTVFYIALIFVVFGLIYVAADHIKTHGVVTGNIVLSTPYSKYLLGENVSFSLTNKYNTAIYVTNQCPAEPVAVYYQESGKWVREHDTASIKDCPSENRQVSVPANSTVTVNLAPWHNLFTRVGHYRLVSVIDGYSTLPYIDFEIVSPPPVIAAVTNPTSSSATQNSSNHGENDDSSTRGPSSTPSSTPSTPAKTPPATKPAAKTVTVHVTSSGNYDTTSITLNTGDSILFVYSPPIASEVRTHFSNIAPTTTSLSSVTLDSEFTTRTKTFSTAGKWSFKADDHSGNTGILTVN
jgi:hypothetical protein